MNVSMLDRAATVATDATHFRWLLGAVVVRGGSVLGVGVTKRRNHPSIVDEDYRHATVHAEMDALSRCGSKVEGATIYVARRTPGRGALAMARPCDECLPEIVKLGLKKVVYTINPDQYGVINVSRHERNLDNAERVYSF